MALNVALAFESGGDARVCADMLAALRAAGTRATIFLDGRWAESHPTLVQMIAADGHELGNHAYSHPDLTTLPDGQIADELEQTEALAVRIAGRSTRPWFRPPFQQLDDRIRRIAAQHGFRCLSRDALDGAHYPGPSTPEAIIERSLARGTEGAVLTYHLQSPNTLKALPDILGGLRERGAVVCRASDLPSPPPERAPLHPDFADLDVDSGYLRMHQAVAPPQMINLLGLGADALAPADQALDVGRADQGRIALFVFNGHEAVALPPATGERHVTCLGGRAVLQVTDAEGAPVCTVFAGPGEAVGLRNGWRATAHPSPKRGRAILLLVE
ncbi:MAG: polysaccharide deacetylase family protein [Armatimonadota bacterium]